MSERIYVDVAEHRAYLIRRFDALMAGWTGKQFWDAEELRQASRQAELVHPELWHHVPPKPIPESEPKTFWQRVGEYIRNG